DKAESVPCHDPASAVTALGDQLVVGVGGHRRHAVCAPGNGAEPGIGGDCALLRPFAQTIGAAWPPGYFVANWSAGGPDPEARNLCGDRRELFEGGVFVDRDVRPCARCAP